MSNDKKYYWTKYNNNKYQNNIRVGREKDENH